MANITNRTINEAPRLTKAQMGNAIRAARTNEMIEQGVSFEKALREMFGRLLKPHKQMKAEYEEGRVVLEDFYMRLSQPYLPWQNGVSKSGVCRMIGSRTNWYMLLTENWIEVPVDMDGAEGRQVIVFIANQKNK